MQRWRPPGAAEERLSVSVKMACERLLTAFIAVCAVYRLRMPASKISRISATLFTPRRRAPGTYGPPLGSSRTLKVCFRADIASVSVAHASDVGDAAPSRNVSTSDAAEVSSAPPTLPSRSRTRSMYTSTNVTSYSLRKPSGPTAPPGSAAISDAAPSVSEPPLSAARAAAPRAGLALGFGGAARSSLLQMRGTRPHSLSSLSSAPPSMVYVLPEPVWP
mmetsp:Transcript_7364/g.21452  ORF Transcript_7364/g.21452 Transcript_7364/m.21452 type:complete len:219 (-) Transcript_7364:35-691(-)